MGRTISIGEQGFEYIIKKNYFYIDKTEFIKQWWDNGDSVTLITRPRRFGKTLNMDMLNCFFSNRYAGRSDIFEHLNIWKYEEFRKLQGTYPVIFLTFADIKGRDLNIAKKQIKKQLSDVFISYKEILQEYEYTENEINLFNNVSENMDDATAGYSLKSLSNMLAERYEKKV